MPSLGMLVYGPDDKRSTGFMKFRDGLAKSVAYICQFHEVDFFYFSPEDIDYSKKKINGRAFNGAGWAKVEKDYPDMVFDRLRRHKHMDLKVYEELKSSIFNCLHLRNIGGKKGTYEHFKGEEFIIPFDMVNNVKDVDAFLKKHDKIILKPVALSGGDGVYSVEVSRAEGLDGLYKVGGRSEVKILNREEFVKFIEKRLSKSTYIIQKFVEAFTKEGSPYDIRVGMSKNGKNEWEILKIVPKIGVKGGEITSIGAYGGSYGIWKGFIEHNFGKSEYEGINTEIRRISLEICKKMENYKGNKLSEFGIDLILDKNKGIYLLEANTTPGIVQYDLELAEAQVNYLLYLYKEGGKNG